MTDQQQHDYQERVSDLADKLLDEAISKGESFGEGLCNWAINEAEKQTAKYG